MEKNNITKQSEIYPYGYNKLSDKEARENFQNFLKAYGPTVVRIGLLASLTSLPAFAEGIPAPSSSALDNCQTSGASVLMPPSLNNRSECVTVSALIIAFVSVLFPPNVVGTVVSIFVLVAQVLKSLKYFQS